MLYYSVRLSQSAVLPTLTYRQGREERKEKGRERVFGQIVVNFMH